jgi:hypothetical protein
MRSEPKTEREKGEFRFPALVTLAPKRRFKANPLTEEESTGLQGERLRPRHRQKLKRSGRVVLRRPSQATHFGPIAPSPLTTRSYAP